MGFLNINKLVNTSYDLNKKTQATHASIEVKNIKIIKDSESLFINKPTKSKYNDLKSMVKNSSVISDSNKIAIANFEKDKRFNKNHINNKNENTTNQLNDGNLTPLKGKGIIGVKNGNTQLPFKCTIINDDKKGMIINQDTNIATNGIKVISGDAIQSAQLIPGTPLGQFYNKRVLDNTVTVVTVPNGQRGVNGIKIPLSNISTDKKVLFSNGALSGCLVFTAIDNNNLYIFHVGKDGNDTSPWKTNIDGANLILKHIEKLLDQKVESPNQGIQDLIDFCSKNLKHTIIQYCGHGETYINKKNIDLFDYNTPQKNNPLRIGNNLTLINPSVDGKLQISTLCDDMSINANTCETSSVLSKHIYLKK
ncbi:cytotoxic necrotizing factor Rho-activating domain-containing protein [Photobacterium damselae]|uniref:cytotoxic necrotizing factor Rho-activating domain-containing protein n=1 Tax=Photobacterium damselae TaxID=38293 RepID=UPI00165E0B33|nr:cytotoxic necrotizing factor Rho-activating domain-containing protein [Photobacterium damselae]